MKRGIGIGLVVASSCAAACGSPPRRSIPPLADQISNGDRDQRQVLLAELQSEVFDAYDRDAPPDLETGVLPRVGAARIGVGPGDLLVDQELAAASSRWPLMIDPSTPTAVRSKKLELHVAGDHSAGWMFDEVSWRIEVCKRTMVIPLRFTAMYARDGDRWVLAVEHLSTGASLPEQGGMIGRSVPAAEVSTSLAEDVAASVTAELTAPIADSPLVSSGPEAVLLGPGWHQEWHGPDIISQQLVLGTLGLEDRREERRIGVVGHDVASATVAYWVGNLVATAPDGARTRLRGTFILEKRSGRWAVVQAHVSLPVDDETLARSTVGSALVSLNPLKVQCDDVPPPVDSTSGAASRE